MTTTQNLVHEADAQRHHVRVRLPARVEIEGQLYEARDWSTAGASIVESGARNSPRFADKKVHDARLIFDFTGFTLAVPMRIEVRHVKEEAGDGVLGLRFIDMTQEQIVIMQQLVSAYITGELSTVGDLIHVLGRNNFTKPRQIPSKEEMSSKERAVSFAKKLAVPLITALLVIYVGTSLFEQNYIVKAHRALVTGSTQVVVTTAGGVASFQDVHPGDTVKKGDVLMTILTDTGTVTGIDSPCDCVVEQRKASTGEVIGKGETVFTLVAMDAPLYVESFVLYEDAVHLAKGQSVKLDLPGGKGRMSGEVTGVTMGMGEGRLVKVKIKPSEAIAPDLVGLPVGVKINTLSN
jgi:alginate biosynthesis protein Alg44